MPVQRRAAFACAAGLFAGLVLAQPSFAQSAVAFEPTPVWKTITLGTFHSIIDLREALESSRCAAATAINSASRRADGIPCQLGNSANEILGRAGFELSESRRQAELVLLSGKDLGFHPDSQPSLREIYSRAQARGYALCTPEVGPELRMQYTNQKIGEFLHIAMNPIRDYAGNATVFSVGNGGAGLLLVGTGGDPDVRVPATAPFVFMRPLVPPLEASVRQANH